MGWALIQRKMGHGSKNCANDTRCCSDEGVAVAIAGEGGVATGSPGQPVEVRPDCQKSRPLRWRSGHSVRTPPDVSAHHLLHRFWRTSCAMGPCRIPSPDPAPLLSAGVGRSRSGLMASKIGTPLPPPPPPPPPVFVSPSSLTPLPFGGGGGGGGQPQSLHRAPPPPEGQNSIASAGAR